MKKIIVESIVLCVFSSSFACRDNSYDMRNEKRITKIIRDVTGHKEGDCICLLQDIAQNSNEKSFSALMQIWEQKLEPELPILIASALYNLEFKNATMKSQLSSLEGMDEANELFLKALEVTSSPEYKKQREMQEAEERRQEELREKELKVEIAKKLEYESYKASMKAAQDKKGAAVRDVLLKYKDGLLYQSEYNLEHDPMGVYSTCFARAVFNKDKLCQHVALILMKDGIIPNDFFMILAQESTFKPEEQFVARILCEFWNNQDLFAQLICDATANRRRFFHFLNYLLFENDPKPDDIWKSLASFKDFNYEESGDSFSVYENMFDRILADAKNGNQRCLEQLFWLRYDAITDPEHYKKFWDIVEQDKMLKGAIINYKLSFYEARGIKVSAEYLGF